MLVINKDKENKLRIKLNEGNTLSYTGGFIFEFINNTSDQATRIHLIDASPYPISYNLFLITDPIELDLETGEYTLNVFVSEEVETTTEGKELIHTDFIKVYGESTGSTEYSYNPE